MANLLINGYDTANSLLFVEDLQGWSDGIGYHDPVAYVSGRAGVMQAGNLVAMDSRQVNIGGVVKGGGVMATLQANLQDLKSRAAAGIVELGFGDNPGIIAYGRLSQFLVAPSQGSPAFVIAERKVSMHFACLDPYLYSSDLTVVALGGGSSLFAPCPLGTGPSLPILRVWNPGAALTVTYADVSGLVLNTIVMAFSPSLGANDYVEWDCRTWQFIKSVSGTVTSIYPVTSGSLLVLDPFDGSTVQGSYPGVKISAGNGELIYRKAWF